MGYANKPTGKATMVPLVAIRPTTSVGAFMFASIRNQAEQVFFDEVIRAEVFFLHNEILIVFALQPSDAYIRGPIGQNGHLITATYIR